MAMFDFLISTPAEIKLDPLALKYLESGAHGFGGILSVENILNNFDPNHGLLIIIKTNDFTIGSIYLTFSQQETGKVMSSVLLGGDGFGEWAAELSQFYYKIAKENDCNEFTLMGRRGFKRYFPELEEVATVFRVSLI